MAKLVLKGLQKAFGATAAVYPTDLDIADGEFVTLLGPSGCGKSTLLRMISGITPPSGGEIWLAGHRIEALRPERRDIAMVFQSYALFPHMTVGKNLAFGLRMKKIPLVEQHKRIEHAVHICKLDGLLDRMPRELSGGQQQRVALARAIVMQPALLLFDEPLSNLDAKLRESLREDLIALHRSLGTTSLYVTHDQAEAMAMSDRILVMNGGRVLESGRPIDLYNQPRHEFTAHFLGQTNLLRLVVDGGVALAPWGQHVAVSGADPSQREILVSLRPEYLKITPKTDGPGRIVAMSFVGAQVHYQVALESLTLRASSSGQATVLSVGQHVDLHSGPLNALQGSAQAVSAA